MRLSSIIKIWTMHGNNFSFGMSVIKFDHMRFIARSRKLPTKNSTQTANSDKLMCAACKYGKPLNFLLSHQLKHLVPTKNGAQEERPFQSRIMHLCWSLLIHSAGKTVHIKGGTDSKDIYHGKLFFQPFIWLYPSLSPDWSKRHKDNQGQY